MAGCAHLASRVAALDPDALWKIVGLQCVPSQRDLHRPGQCTFVDLTQRYAVLKDISGRAQHLLIPTDRITGIESPEIVAADAPEYWSYAWLSRRYVEASLKQTVTANAMGMEINSKYRRSQQQLHIHLDCMRKDVTTALASHRNDTVGQWRWDTLDGQRYRIMRVTSLTQTNNPFHIVARDKKDPVAMGMQTILVTGASASTTQDGWLIVNSGMDVDNGSGSAEGLLDHGCAIAPRH
ncbi:CDP-diacylglycerol diphosphatase [Paraburkholderia sp.]|uniref:CDP-diacylglycerol diphosphatase n=1 Tax=Paraburkholderia sp. TaxID=1926495 RepID=UPI0023A1F086|nr:CDP-diacylglycerol diphosphatase [Paraburkholderia sp.]MDE1182585.1 CDP-diacylglycerol diphosphatase [Paraburkholderia sp.]